VPYFLVLVTLTLFITMAMPAKAQVPQVTSACGDVVPSYPRPELAPFAGRWGGHLVQMFVLGDGTAVVLWPLGHAIRDGAFVTGGGASDETVLLITTVTDNAATGCVISSPRGQVLGGGF
jgi:hypothetical protein